ncbi:MAG TPA: hypothetical protein VES65_10640 [Solirubrobacteraceae bacterium]|nr:hypothetical protein [Solirubrobacteraceae bacterium]
MLLGLATAALVVTALVCELSRQRLGAAFIRAHADVRRRLLAYSSERAREQGYDPGRERRAELRARALLRSCVNEEEWAMYRDLGFLRVSGRSGGQYAYLLYPHKPLLAYVPQTGALLSEYCVAFPDGSKPYGSARLPDSDDVLAKWMALTADEHRLIADANMHLPGRQLDPERVRRDLERLARWECERAQKLAGEPELTSATLASQARHVGHARHGRVAAGSVRAA